MDFVDPVGEGDGPGLRRLSDRGEAGSACGERWDTRINAESREASGVVVVVTDGLRLFNRILRSLSFPFGFFFFRIYGHRSLGSG